MTQNISIFDPFIYAAIDIMVFLLVPHAKIRVGAMFLLGIDLIYAALLLLSS